MMYKTIIVNNLNRVGTEVAYDFNPPRKGLRE